MNNQPEYLLVIRLKEGQYAAFEELYACYKDRLVAFLASLHLQQHAEDVIQDTFTRIWLNRENLDPNKSFESYLFTIAKNYALKALKKHLHQQLASSEAYELACDSSADQDIICADIEAVVTHSLAQLPERPRNIYQLKREENMTTKEISRKLSISNSSVENHMNKALKSIRKHLSLLVVLFLLNGSTPL